MQGDVVAMDMENRIDQPNYNSNCVGIHFPLMLVEDIQTSILPQVMSKIIKQTGFISLH